MFGPRKVEHFAEGMGSQAGVAMCSNQGALETHVLDLANRSRRQAVAAGLDPGEDLLLNQSHIPAGLGQPVSAGRPCRATADHQDIVDVSVGGRRV